VADRAFTCKVITPERTALSTKATFAAIPAHDGEIGILRDRAPLLCKLGIGVLRIEAQDGQKRYFIDGGFAQVLNNTVTLLTEQAMSESEIDADAARSLAEQARKQRAITAEEHAERSRDMARAAAQLKTATSA